MLRLISRNEHFAVLLVENFNPDKSSTRHNCFHKSKVKAPDHYNTEYNSKWYHDNPVFYISKRKDGVIVPVGYTIVVFVDLAVFGVVVCFEPNIRRLILFEEGVEQESALGKEEEDEEQADVPSNHGEEWLRT